MLKATHSQWQANLFHFYLKWSFRKNFRRIEGVLPKCDPTKSVLVLANHMSWWDGFFFLRLNRLSNRKLYVMMLESELKKHRFLQYLGAYSVNPGHRSQIESLRYTEELLQTAGNTVLIFPQGILESQHIPSIQFKPGIERLIEKNQDQFTLVFAHTFIDYGSYAKPSVYTYCENISPESLSSFHSIENAYQHFFEKTRQIHAEKLSGGTEQ